MGCGSGRPIATQIGAGITACQIVQSTNPDLEEAKLELRRTINYLVGHNKKGIYDDTVGGMRYETVKPPHPPEDEGLGQGIIPDLEKVQKLPRGKYRLDPANAGAVLKVAEVARDLAEKGLEESTIHKVHQSAKIVSSLLQAALEVVLA